MMKLRPLGGGLGDTVYMRAVVLHLLKRGEKLKVFTRYPDMFADLPLEVAPEQTKGKQDADVRVVGYSAKERQPPGVDIFQRTCRNTGIAERVELRIDWKVRNTKLLDKIKRDANGRRIFVYQPLKAVNDKKPWSPLTKPRREAFVKVLERHADFYRVKLGHPPSVPEDKDMPCELDLWGRAFIFDTFDVLSIADLCFSQPSFINAAAEALDKNYICMFSRAALNSSYVRVSSTTPESLFHKKHLATAVYDD